MNVATEKTEERMIVVLNCRQSCIAVSEGNTIRLEIRSAHHAHAKDDRDGCEKGDDHIIEPCPCAGGGGERFIKGNRKYTVIKQNEKEYDGDAEDDGKANIIGAHGKDAAEHVVAHVGIHSRT